MPVWLGQAPSGNGWRYMHEDGRVEDIDPAAMGMPPGWTPPGFESAMQPPPPPVAPAAVPSAQSLPPDFISPDDSSGMPADFISPDDSSGMPADFLTGNEPRMFDQRAQFAPGGSAQVTPPQTTASSTPLGSASTRTSYSGPGLPIDFQPSDRMAKRAANSARAQAGMYDPALAAQAAAGQTEADLLAQQSAAKEQGLIDQAAAMHRNAEMHAREVQAIDARARDWTGRIEQAMNEIPTIDSSKLFNDASTAQTAAMAISAFMGGFLQPVLGTNAPMDIINKAIDRSVSDQMAAQQAAQRKVWNTKDLAQADQEQARWALHEADISRLGHLTALEREVDAKIAGYQSDIFKNKGSMLKADLLKAKTDLFRSIYDKELNFGLEQYKAYQQAAHYSRSDALALREANARAAAGSGADDTRAIRRPDTGEVIGELKGGTPAQVAEYNAKQAASYSAARSVLHLNKLVKENGALWKKSNWGSTEKAQELRGVYNDLLSDIIKAKTGAAATEAEIKRLETVLPFPSKINPDIFRNLENRVEKVIDEQNTLNTTSLVLNKGTDGSTFDFKSAVNKLRAEYASNDPETPIASMHEGLLQLRAARTPDEVQTTVRKLLTAAEESASVDSGRAGIQQAIDELRQIPLEARSLPSVDGDIDPVRKLETMIGLGAATEGARSIQEQRRATEAQQLEDLRDASRKLPF